MHCCISGVLLLMRWDLRSCGPNTGGVTCSSGPSFMVTASDAVEFSASSGWGLTAAVLGSSPGPRSTSVVTPRDLQSPGISLSDSGSDARSKPASCCHFDATLGLPDDGRLVSKRSSKAQWNCGDTNPVVRLSTSATFLECLGDVPT